MDTGANSSVALRFLGGLPTPVDETRAVLVTPRIADFQQPLQLTSGRTLSEFSIAYECYGELNGAADNGILIGHGLSGTAHAAGRHKPEDTRPGWWDHAIGPGKMFDTNRYYVVCTNVLGGCGGSSGPSSSNPATGRPYALDFPVVTIADMVEAQVLLSDRLGIERWHCVAGGCLGGAQALTWGRNYPQRTNAVLSIGATAETSAHSLAFFEVIRETLRRDPNWNGGNYYDGPEPTSGLTLGSLIGMLFWMSPDAMDQRFGRAQTNGGIRYTLGSEFKMQEFLQSIATNVERKFDPNTLLYVTRAMDYFDLAEGFPDLRTALDSFAHSALLVSYQTDWRYPPHKIERLAQALRRESRRVEHVTLESIFGHGAYLFDIDQLAPLVRSFLEEV